MKITIDIPESKCSKCAATAATQPRLLHLASLPVATKNVLSAVMKGQANANAMDNHGQRWEVLADDKPAGWTKIGASDLCALCSAAWEEAEKAFLVPLPPKVVPKPAPTPAIVAKSAPSRTRFARRGGRIAAVSAAPPTPAPTPAPRKAAPTPVITKPTFGSSVPATHRIIPTRRTRLQPAPKLTKQVTSGGDCSIPNTSFGSSVPLPVRIVTLRDPIQVAQKPSGPRPMYGGGVTLPKTDFGSTVPVPTTRALVAAAKRAPRQATS